MDKEKRRRRSWFERIRRLFTSSSDPNPTPKPADKKAKSKRWLPGKLRSQQSFALPAPAPSGAPADQIRQAEDEQSKHAVAVALATAAAAEAAVAAAQAAAHVVRLTGQPTPAAPVLRQEQEQEHAAVAIQSVYRGYLARRALRALKGLVRLQALIRGQAVRRQTAATLRGLESLMRIQGRRHRPPPAGGRRRAAAAPRQGALCRRRRRRPRATAAGEQQGVGQQHLVQGGDERDDEEQGGGGAQARARAAVRLPAQREAGPRQHPPAAVHRHVQGRRGKPALELAGGVGRLAAALRQGRPRRAPVPLHQHHHHHHQEGGRRSCCRHQRRRHRRPARLLGPPVLSAAAAHAREGRQLLQRRVGGGVLAGAGGVPGVHGLDGVRQGQVQVAEHAQGALRRRLLRALLPVRRPPALTDPVHVAHALHRQRHGLRQVHQAARRAAVAPGGGQEPHDAREAALVAEVAPPPQLRLRGGAAPAADGALHPSPLNLAF